MQVEETTQSTPLRPTRAGFVRGLPLTMPVGEVIERGREVGLELQPSDIHAARYYMRQVAAAESSSIPQQLLLGGTFVTKREPRKGSRAANSANSANGANGTAAANGAQTVEKAGLQEPLAVLRDADYELPEEEEPETAITSKRRGRKPAPVQKNAKFETKHTKDHAKDLKSAKDIKNAKDIKSAHKAKSDGKANGASANGLHSRLQARLRNVTFRDTAREERDAAREQKATIGKALLDLDTPIKPRGKRGVQTADALEQQVRTIALRVGTQRVRELLDAMEELARKA